ncbi:MAG: hypothetical protein ACJAS1_006484 [Oleiphilaceae bacterium]|jgi:hypothetical protein
MNITQLAPLLLLTVFSYDTQAEKRAELSQVTDRVELETSFIKGNKELPQVLYIVPWQEIKKSKHKQGKMVLHSLYGDIFQPVTPEDLAE